MNIYLYRLFYIGQSVSGAVLAKEISLKLQKSSMGSGFRPLVVHGYLISKSIRSDACNDNISDSKLQQIFEFSSTGAKI
jgi:hypothetical protein